MPPFTNSFLRSGIPDPQKMANIVSSLQWRCGIRGAKMSSRSGGGGKEGQPGQRDRLAHRIWGRSTISATTSMNAARSLTAVFDNADMVAHPLFVQRFDRQANISGVVIHHEDL